MPFDFVLFFGTQAANGETGAGERMALQEFCRQAELCTDLADFVLIEEVQGFDDAAFGRSASEFRQHDCGAS